MGSGLDVFVSLKSSDADIVPVGLFNRNVFRIALKLIAPEVKKGPVLVTVIAIIHSPLLHLSNHRFYHQYLQVLHLRLIC